jgi:hypothetical protein
VKGLKVAVAPDKRSVTVSGEWEKAAKSGGSDVIVAIKLTEERVISMPPAMTHVTGMVAPRVPCVLPLPPVAPGLTREYQIEIRQTSERGQSSVVARGPDGGRGSVKFPWAANSGPYRFSATMEADKVVVGAMVP